jgi:hypothetical protein
MTKMSVCARPIDIFFLTITATVENVYMTEFENPEVFGKNLQALPVLFTG